MTADGQTNEHRTMLTISATSWWPCVMSSTLLPTVSVDELPAADAGLVMPRSHTSFPTSFTPRRSCREHQVPLLNYRNIGLRTATCVLVYCPERSPRHSVCEGVPWGGILLELNYLWDLPALALGPNWQSGPRCSPVRCAEAWVRADERPWHMLFHLHE